MSELATLTMITEAVAIVCMITWFVRDADTRYGKKPAVPALTPVPEDDEVTEKAVAAWPCPFCGCIDLQTITAPGKDGYACVRCEKCEADGPVIWDELGRVSDVEMKRRAIEAWDFRRNA